MQPQMNQSIWKCIVVILIAYCLCVMDAEWIQSDVILPPGVDDAAVGFYDDQIYIFGGGEYKRQLIRYNGSFTVIGTNELPHDLYGGFYDDQFYIFGGGEYKRQLIRYNGSFTVIGTNELPHDLYGVSQFYRQHQNTLYMI
eukprot:984235_1